MRRIHVLGDLNLDLILSGMGELPALGKEVLAPEHCFKAGGSAANVAVVLALLGAPVRLFACVGRDPVGAFVLADLRRQGLGTAEVSRLRGQFTGVTVSLSYPQERMYVTGPGSLASAGLESFKKGYLRRGAHLHVGSFFLQRRLRPAVAALLAGARRVGMTTSLDPGHDPDGRWELRELEAALPCLDWLLPNAPEACALAGVGELEEALGRLGERLQRARQTPNGEGPPGREGSPGGAVFGVAVKAGAEGAWLWQEGRISHFPAAAVTALDPTCAGDCFDAGFLRALCCGLSPAQAVAEGNRVGALGASCLGLPSRELLRGNGPFAGAGAPRGS